MHQKIMFFIILICSKLILTSHHPENTATFFSSVVSNRKDHNIHTGRASQPVLELTCTINSREPLDHENMKLHQDFNGNLWAERDSTEKQYLGRFSELNLDAVSLAAFLDKIIFEIPVLKQ